MSAKTKVKLTASQQEVVNLMAVGWELTWHPDMGRFAKASASFSNKDRSDRRKLASNMPHQLSDKGVIESYEPKDKHWRSTYYRLTKLGKSLAVAPEKATESETWYRVEGVNITVEKFARSTADCLISADGRKKSKSTQWEKYFPHRFHAVNYIRSQLESDVSRTEAAFRNAQAALAAFEKREGK